MRLPRPRTVPQILLRRLTNRRNLPGHSRLRGLIGTLGRLLADRLRNLPRRLLRPLGRLRHTLPGPIRRLGERGTILRRRRKRLTQTKHTNQPRPPGRHTSRSLKEPRRQHTPKRLNRSLIASSSPRIVRVPLLERHLRRRLATAPVLHGLTGLRLRRLWARTVRPPLPLSQERLSRLRVTLSRFEAPTLSPQILHVLLRTVSGQRSPGVDRLRGHPVLLHEPQPRPNTEPVETLTDRQKGGLVPPPLRVRRKPPARRSGRRWLRFGFRSRLGGRLRRRRPRRRRGEQVRRSSLRSRSRRRRLIRLPLIRPLIRQDRRRTGIIHLRHQTPVLAPLVRRRPRRHAPPQNRLVGQRLPQGGGLVPHVQRRTHPPRANGTPTAVLPREKPERLQAEKRLLDRADTQVTHTRQIVNTGRSRSRGIRHVLRQNHGNKTLRRRQLDRQVSHLV